MSDLGESPCLLSFTLCISYIIFYNIELPTFLFLLHGGLVEKGYYTKRKKKFDVEQNDDKGCA